MSSTDHLQNGGTLEKAQQLAAEAATEQNDVVEL